MTKLIFAFMQAYGGDERESLLLARSLRTFGGELANHPLWMMMPQNLEQVSETTFQALSKLDVQLHRFEVPEEALKFPFGGKVYAAAVAESLASNEADILVWMDSDTIFVDEPAGLVPGDTVELGYRPVMLKNISSLYDEHQENILYRIFIHQAILAGTILASLKKDKMHDLGTRFNYPVFLEGTLEPANDVVTLRYDGFDFFQQPCWEDKAPSKGTVKEWLCAQVR